MYRPSDSAGVRDSVGWGSTVSLSSVSVTPRPEAVKFHRSEYEGYPNLSPSVTRSLIWENAGGLKSLEASERPISTCRSLPYRWPSGGFTGQPQTQKRRTRPRLVEYKVAITTGEQKDAGTNAKVGICLHGHRNIVSKEFSRPISDTASTDYLNSKRLSCRFERGKAVNFTFNDVDVGELKYVVVEHLDETRNRQWHLIKLIITKINHKTGLVQTWELVCKDWFYGYMEKKLFPEAVSDGERTYNISLHTSRGVDAGTTSNVFLVLYGDQNQSEEIRFQNKGNNFRSGRIATKSVSTLDLGPLYKVWVRHDNSGSSPAWLLDKIVVEDAETKETYVFICEKVLKGKRNARFLKLSDADEDRYERTDDWKVRLTLGEILNTSKKAQIWIALFGEEKGAWYKTEDTVLMKLNSTNNDIQKIRLRYVGTPYKLRVWLESTETLPALQIKDIYMENQGKKHYKFFCGDSGRWLSTDATHGPMRTVHREMAIVDRKRNLKYPHTKYQLMEYSISVYTGDVLRAGTDANVFINIFGTQGDTGNRPLKYDKDKVFNKFERKQRDDFTIEAVDLGELEKIRIGHDEKLPGSGWYLEKVVVSQSDRSDKSQTTNKTFHCKRWLDTDEDDGQIVRELFADGSRGRIALTSYHVRIRTGDKQLSGTDANVKLNIIGQTGETGPLKLAKGKTWRNKFERNHIDSFRLEASHVGKVRKIHLSHDNTKPGSGWYVDYVEIDVPSDGKSYRFSCTEWLDSDPSVCDGETQRYYTKPNVDTYKKKIPYEVIIWTGDVSNAGTDANVFIQMYNQDKKTEEIRLENQSDNFEQGAKETFKVEAEDIGEITKIRVGHDNKGLGPGWFLNRVIIRKTLVEDFHSRISKSPRDIEEYVFICNRWFAKDEDDGHIVREIARTDQGDKSKIKLVKYTVYVKTGTVHGAGTDANVFLLISGLNGDTGERQLEVSSTNINKFENNNEDIFTIEAVNLGRLESVRIRHDNKGGFADWFLDNITVEDPTTQKKYYFPCGEWLSKKQGLQKTFFLEDKKRLQKTTIYQVKIKTGDVGNAGTSAMIYFTLHGAKGSSDVVRIKKQGDQFQTGATDAFDVECHELGDLEKLSIGHDNTGWGAGWFLDKVTVKSHTRGRAWTFECNRWLADDEEDRETEVNLLCSRQDVETESVMYEITTHTSNIRWAGTDANVYIILKGESKKTKKLFLVPNEKERKDRFESGQTDSFRVALEEVGKIKRVVIGHDGSGKGAGWHLDRVIVSRLRGKKGTETLVFPCGEWLAADEGDKRIERELKPRAS